MSNSYKNGVGGGGSNSPFRIGGQTKKNRYGNMTIPLLGAFLTLPLLLM